MKYQIKQTVRHMLKNAWWDVKWWTLESLARLRIWWRER